MDRFTQELPSNLSHKMHVWGEDEVPSEPTERCVYCCREGGTPLIVIGGETHCSLCFEDFTEAEFAKYLEDAGAGDVPPFLGPGHPLYTTAVNLCQNCLETAERLTASPDDEFFLLCDECMEEAVAKGIPVLKRIASEVVQVNIPEWKVA